MKASKTRQPRPERVSVALSPEELEAIDARALETGLSRSDILRRAARTEATMNTGGSLAIRAIKR